MSDCTRGLPFAPIAAGRRTAWRRQTERSNVPRPRSQSAVRINRWRFPPRTWACERAARTGTRADALVAGAAGGALALIRTLGAVVIPATVLVLAWRRRWTAALIVLAAGVAIMLPWQLWIAAWNDKLPAVFLGRYGSYSGWLVRGVQDGGIAWLLQLVVFNLRLVVEGGWQLLAIEPLHPALKWLATVVATAMFGGGWLLLLRRAPVAATMVALYLAVGLVVEVVVPQHVQAAEHGLLLGQHGAEHRDLGVAVLGRGGFFEDVGHKRERARGGFESPIAPLILVD